MTKARAAAAIAAALLAYGAIGTSDLEAQVAAEREAAERRATWDFVGERAYPITLADCRPEDVISISQNSGVVMPWRSFCSSSFKVERKPKPTKKGRKK